MALAFDFGTCNSVVARWNEALNDIETPDLPNLGILYPQPGSEPARVIPSVIHFAVESALLVGSQVDAAGVVNHPGTFRWLKMDMLRNGGANRGRRVNGRVIYPRHAADELVDRILMFMRGYFGDIDEEIVLTVPVEAFDHYIDWLREAAIKRFPGGITFIDEATACMLGYIDKVLDREPYCIVDFGDQFRHLREPAATFSKLAATPETVLDIIDDYKGSATFVLKDFHHFLEHNRRVSRMLRNLASRLPFRSETVNIIITSPQFALPVELRHDIPTIDVGKPDGKQILELLDRETRSTRALDNATHGLRERLVESALGLSIVEAGRAFRKAIVVAGGHGLDERSVRQVLNEKRHIIRESGALELYPYTGSMNNVGGLGALKAWLDERQEAFSQDAREYGLSMPKGVALIGIPGTGKSLCAKVTAGHWGMTLLRMDVGAIFSGLLGSSEQNIREAIRIAEVIAPCVLWVDEIEKAFAGSMGDSGTASRVFATFLTWMQEKTAPVFVFATANNVRRLPPELLRKGRVDEVFFLDLPTHGERIKILEVHLRERGYTMLSQRFNLGAVSSATEGFVGAELQALVNDAMFPAFRDNRRELETEDLLNAAAEMVPLSASHQEHIEQLRTMVVNGQARNASDDRNASAASSKTGDHRAQ